MRQSIVIWVVSCWAMLTSTAHGQSHAGDVGVGRSAAGQLKIVYDLEQIKPLLYIDAPPYFTGYLDDNPGFDAITAAQVNPELDLYQLQPGTNVWLEALELAPGFSADYIGFYILDNPGDVGPLGTHTLHTHYTWMLDPTGDPGWNPDQCLWTGTFRLIDQGSTNYSPSEPFTLQFSIFDNDGSEADCNENQLRDECEIQLGLQDDCNIDGQLDMCELPTILDFERYCVDAQPVCPGYIYEDILFSFWTPAIPSSCASLYRQGWYQYTPATNGVLTVSTCGSNFDTVVSIYDGIDGCPSGLADELACNENYCGTGSEVSWDVEAGHLYYISIAGKSGSGQSGQFNMTLTGPVCYQGPGNDCNANSIPDDCDIADGTSFDCNHNTEPDECEMISLNCPFAPGDVNNDGQVDPADIYYFIRVLVDLDQFPCHRTASDLDGNGRIDIRDVKAFLLLVHCRLELGSLHNRKNYCEQLLELAEEQGIDIDPDIQKKVLSLCRLNSILPYAKINSTSISARRP
ncbi:MAG: hypothetical protein HJJLKODD_00161 [Phycisphaerae bacterium]|nr:hypothetical protein [Phycisphaerae bacterium]